MALEEGLRMTRATTRRQIRADLLAYCERDTLAMVRIVEALRAIADESPRG